MRIGDYKRASARVALCEVSAKDRAVGGVLGSEHVPRVQPGQREADRDARKRSAARM